MSMRRIYFFTGFVLLISTLMQGQADSYKTGEKVTYTIQIGFITAGTGTLELRSDTFNGREVWHSKLAAKTTGMAEVLYRVLDIYESFIDPITELPVKSIRNIHEGRYRKYNVVLFDHKTRSDSSILNSDLTGIHITYPDIHDILSCFYWFRNHSLPSISGIQKGEIITIMTW